MKRQVGEQTDYEQLITFLRQSYGPAAFGFDAVIENMLIAPINFRQEHREMLAHVKGLMEYNKGYVAINPKYDKLITALRTAVEKGEGSLDKEATSYDNLFDAFRMYLRNWRV